MKICRDWHDLPADARGHAVALGNFDGVHRGHAHLLHQTHAARPDLALAVLSFEPHPREFFRPGDPPFRLSLPEERADALAALGVAVLYELNFDAAFAHMTAVRFIEDILVAGIGARHVGCGIDFAFGHRRGGNARLLEQLLMPHGIGVTPVPLLADEEAPISSTKVRRMLQDGYPDRAAQELGRPYAVAGIVTKGDQRGRTIGFPTANIPLGRHLEPARGAYAVKVRLPDGRLINGVANIGVRPTVAGTESRIEAHLFGFDEDLYGQRLVVELHQFLREERKFPSFEALKQQITEDASAARAMLERG